MQLDHPLTALADAADLLRLLEQARRLLDLRGIREHLGAPDAALDRLQNSVPSLVCADRLAALHLLETLKQRYGANPALVEQQVDRYARLVSEFQSAYGAGPVMLVAAPARIEIGGGHIDYVDYFRNKVLAFGSREYDMVVAARARPDRRIGARSLQAGFEPQGFSLDDCAEIPGREWLQYLEAVGNPPGNWVNYVKGAALYLQHGRPGVRLRGLDLLVDSTIPVSGGASSSSALVTASVFALSAANDLSLDLAGIADAASRAEWYIGTRGGKMDHAALSFSCVHHALLITSRPFGVARVPVPVAGYEWITAYTVRADKGQLLAADNEISAVSCALLPFLFERLLAENAEYRSAWQRMQRAIEAEDAPDLAAALADLGPLVNELSETLSLEEVKARSPEMEREIRARYPALCADAQKGRRLAVRRKAAFHLGEIARVLAESAALRDAVRAQVRGDTAAEAERMAELGRLMNATHQGLGDLYGVGTPDTDRVAELARDCPGVLGARVMGFGFGGNVLALVRSDQADALARTLQEGYYRPRGRDGAAERSLLRHTPGSGIGIVDPARTARLRLLALVNEDRRWEDREPEILALAMGLLGVRDLSEYVPRRPVRPVILAGGKGTRAGLPMHKVLAPIKGKPAIEWVLGALGGMGNVQPAVLIVSEHQDRHQDIRAQLDGKFPVEYVVEKELFGTGHAVLQSEPLLKDFEGTVLVTEGTQALIRRETVLKSLLVHEAVGFAAMTLPTARKERPYAYLVRDEQGFVADSRETRLESADIIDYGEDNVSVYLVRSEDLFGALRNARRRALDPQTGRYRLGQLGFPNEMVKSLRLQSKLVLGLCFADPREAQSIKYAEDIPKVERYMDQLARQRSTARDH